ncbi:MAG: hypothetical protein DSY80_01155 [Desulfocapsa sp.]|nr:MAG: hypothetical protein DSY80_01155 [Desulfocapsa sp.]
MELKKIVLTGGDGESRVYNDYSSNCSFQIENDSFFVTDDPHYILHITNEELKNLDSVTVHVSFKALGEEALSRISLIQQEKLQKLSGQINAPGVIKAAVKAFVPHENEKLLQYVKRQLKPF